MKKKDINKSGKPGGSAGYKPRKAKAAGLGGTCDVSTAA